MHEDAEAEFTRFVVATSPALRRMAMSVAGDHHRADDLVQTTFEKLYVAWPRLARRGQLPLSYARQTLIRTLISEDRRPAHRREVLTELPEHGHASSELVDDRVDMIEALSQLSPRQRLVLYLRHYEDLSVAQTATAMGCSQGTVKSTTSDAVRVLRRLQEVVSDV